MQRFSPLGAPLRSFALQGPIRSSTVRSVQLTAAALQEFEKQNRAFEPLPNLPPSSTEPLTPPTAKLTKLPNGVRVATLFSKTPVASLGVFFDAGSRYDTADTAGASYLLARLGYAGTHRRSSLRLIREFDILGAEYKPVADRDHISYRANLVTNAIPSVSEVLTDVAQPKLAEWEVRDQQHKVLDVVEAESAANAEIKLIQRLHEEAFRNAGLGNPLSTPAYNADNLTYDVLQGIVKQLYTPDRLVLVGTGGVEHEVLVKLAEQHLSKLSGKSSVSRSSSPYVGGNDAREPGVGPTELGIAFQGVSFAGNTKEYHAANVLQFILGGASSPTKITPYTVSTSTGTNTSRLAKNVAQANSFVKAVRAFNYNYADNGLFGVIAKAERGNVSSLVKAVTAELASLARNGPTAEEVSRAKAQYKAAILFNDKKSELLEFIGEQALFRGEVQTPEQVAQAVDSLSAGDVAALAKRVFSSKPTVVAVGDVSGLPTIEQVQKLLQ